MPLSALRIRTLKNKFKFYRDKLGRIILQKQVKNLDFTIIANNCWGSRIYQELALPYNTPFVGLFFAAPCYIRLLNNLEHYLNQEMTFVDSSKYLLFRELSNYPIGVLDEDVEIHFRHYKSKKEASEKWHRRVNRMNMNNLFIAFSDRDIFSKGLLDSFDVLPFKNKVCFTARRYPDSPSAIFLPEYAGKKFIGDIYSEHHIYKRHFDVADWLNGGSGRINGSTLMSRLYSL